VPEKGKGKAVTITGSNDNNDEGEDEDEDDNDEGDDDKVVGLEEEHEAKLRKKGKGVSGKVKEARVSKGGEKVSVEERFEFFGLAEDEEEEGVVEGMGVTAEVNPLDAYCNGAIFSYCRIDILQPPAPLKFGTWNDRPLLEKQAKMFATQISNTSFRPFAHGNLLPLVIEREYVDEACIQMNPNAAEAPFLKLTAAALSDKKMELKFAGGRHRRRATELLRDQSKARIVKLREGIADLRGKMKEAEEKGKRRDKFEEKIKVMEHTLVEEKQLEETISFWGVILYDAVSYHK
jgi:hypothetical protein